MRNILLFIVIFFPFTLFSQSNLFDKIILVKGDTISVNILESGIKTITYAYENETNTNIIKSSKIAKIIFKSGREQIFKGNKILQKKINRKQQRGNWRIHIGGNTMFPFSQTFDWWADQNIEGSPVDEWTTRLGLVCQVSHILKFNRLLAYSPSISYYLTNSNKNSNYGNTQLDLNVQHHYVSFTNSIQYNVSPKLTTSIGFSLDKLLKFNEKGDITYVLSLDASDLYLPPSTISHEHTIDTLLGFYISLPLNINYVIHENKNYDISLYTDIKIPIYYSKNKHLNEFNQILKPQNLLRNRNMTLGLAISF